MKIKLGKITLSLILAIALAACDTGKNGNSSNTGSSSATSNYFASSNFGSSVISSSIEEAIITLNKSKLTLEVNDEFKLVASVENSSGPVTWSSLSSGIVSVDQEGNIKALSIGETTIKAAIGSVFAECQVIVGEAGLSFAKENAQDLLTDIMDAKIPVNDTGRLIYEEWYSSSDWSLLLSKVEDAREAVEDATSIAGVDAAIIAARSSEASESHSLYNVPRLMPQEYKNVAYNLIDQFLATLDPSDYFDDYWEGVNTYLGDAKTEISNMSGVNNTLENIKLVKDAAITRIIDEALTKLRFITWWNIDSGNHNVESLMNALAEGETSGLDAAVINFLTIPAILIMEEDGELFDIFFNEFYQEYKVEINLALQYFMAMDVATIKDYLVGAFYAEMLFLVSSYGLIPEVGANIADVLKIFTDERVFTEETDKDYHSPVASGPLYDAASVSEFNAVVESLDVSGLKSAKNLTAFVTQMINLMDEFFYQFWQIGWSNDIHRTVTFDPRGGLIDGDAGKVLVDIRFRDLDTGSEETEDYRGTYYVVDELYSGFDMFWNMYDNVVPVKDDIKFLGWVDGDNRVPEFSYFFDYMIREGALYDYTRQISALWEESALLEGNPIVGTWVGSYMTYIINEDGTWSNNYYTGYVQERFDEVLGCFVYDLIRSDTTSQGTAKIGEGANAGQLMVWGAFGIEYAQYYIKS